jgi:hypothetical protein
MHGERDDIPIGGAPREHIPQNLAHVSPSSNRFLFLLRHAEKGAASESPLLYLPGYGEAQLADRVVSCD